MIQLISIFLLSALFNYHVYLRAKNISYIGKTLTSDNQKMIEAASEIGLTHWPSRMHNISYCRGQLREFWVLTLSVMIKILGFKKCEGTNIALSLFSNWLNTLLIFIISANFIELNQALLVSAIYLFSSWTYQVAFYLGHIIFSQTWALLSILMILYFFKYNQVFFLFLSSIFITVSFFSSSASRKFPYLWLCLYAYFEHVIGTQNDHHLFKSIYMNFMLFLMIILLILSYILTKNIISNWIFFLSKSRFSNSGLLNKIKNSNILTLVTLYFYLLIILVIIITNFILNNNFKAIIQLIFVTLGVSLVTTYIFGPDLLASLNRYRVFLNIGNWANHFRAYVKNSLEIFGRSVPADYRGGSIRWFVRFQNQVSPIIFYIYLVSLTVIFLINFIALPSNIGHSGVILVISLIPIIVHNLTKGIQVGKAYYPQILGYFTMLIFLVYTLDEAYESPIIVSSVLLFLVCFSIVHLLLISMPDLLTSRSSVKNLRNFLIANNVKTFSTYDNVYNDSLVKILQDEDLSGEFNIRYCSSILNSETKYFVVPNRSAKSVSMESTKEAVSGSDFDNDDFLILLEKQGLLDQLTIFKFATLGSSKNYLSESEVTGFRYFELSDYSQSDFDKTFGRVIDTSRLLSLQINT